MIWVLNIIFVIIGVAVFVGWIRNRRRYDYRDIESREISDDFVAQEELLEDALTEHTRSRSGSAESHPATPHDPRG
jgi:uncharacterized membrane protein YjgN (DUF898 family)